MTNAKKLKGNFLNEEGAMFQFTFKKYYNFEITVEHCINTDIHKCFYHNAKKIQEIPELKFSTVYNFYWDSCNRHTILTYYYIFEDDFFAQLIRDEVTEEEKKKICTNVENYLQKTVKDLEQIESCIIRGDFLTVWDYVSDWDKAFSDCSEIKIKTAYKGDCRMLGTSVEINGTDKNVLLGSLIIKKVMMSEDKMEVVFETVSSKEIILSKHAVVLRLTKMSSDASFLSITHVAIEYIAKDELTIIARMKKKILRYLKDRFDVLYKEKKNTRHKQK